MYSEYYYSVDDAENKQKLRKKYIKNGISVLKNLNAPIILDESIISNHKQLIHNCGIDLPNNALRFGRGFKDDGSYIYYGVGDFDCWCVYERVWNGYEWKEFVPLDREYFKMFLDASAIYGAKTVWDDFWEIYLRTGSEINYDVFREIHEISQKYNPALLMEKALSIIYLAMISEENKILSIGKNGKPHMTHLGKMIKALGMYQVLVLGVDPIVAASFSKKPEGGWQALESLCAGYGITRIYK